MPRKANNTQQSTDFRTEHRAPSRGITPHTLLWLLAAFAWLLVAASMLSYTPADPFGHASAHAITPVTNPNAPANTPQTANWIGDFGAFVSSELFEMLGIGAWVILTLALVALLITAFHTPAARHTDDETDTHTADAPIPHLGVRALGAAVVGLSVSGAHALAAPDLSAMPEGAGGLVMIAVTGSMTQHLGDLGTTLTLAFLALLGAWVVFDHWLYRGPQIALATTLNQLRTITHRTRSAAATIAAQRANDIDDDKRLKRVEAFVKNNANRPKTKDTIDEQAGGIGATATLDPDATAPTEADEDWSEDDEYEYEDPEDGYEDEDNDAPGAPQVFDREALQEKIAQLPIRFASADRKQATQEDLDLLRAERKSQEEADRAYQFPGLDILEDPEENFNEELEEWVRNQATALEEALQTYRIEGEVVGIESGPVITLYRVRLAPGTKVSQVTPVTSDIARMLKAVNIRVVPNEAGTDTVGIEVPNLRKEKVRLKELMTNSESAGRMKLPMFLGKDASGNPLVIDLASLPHMLIAGTTGSGKSVCMNAIITGFLYTQKPSDMKLVLVDPKMVELSQFKDIPHLMCPVVTEMSKAAAILEWAVTKMDERYELLAEAGVRDISAYNNLEWDELKERFNPANELEEAKIPRKLPYMVFIIDELADLMMTNKEVEGAIVRIAQKARAVGIHLILATQRPQANVVTGLIKSNMPGRVAFKVASGMDSRIVLDQKGGELLLGHGDMLMLTPRSGTTIRAQGTLVDDHEIRRVVKFVRDVSGPTYERDLATIDSHGYDPNDPESSDDDFRTYTAAEYEERMRKSAQEDPLFDRAVEIVLETKRGSVSLLQRRLAIGYTRASRLIELMGMCGIIGKHKGSVAREVMMTTEEWDAMKQLAEEERAAAEASSAASDDAPEDSLFTTDDEPIDTDAKDDEAPIAAAPPFIADEPHRAPGNDAPEEVSSTDPTALDHAEPEDVTPEAVPEQPDESPIDATTPDNATTARPDATETTILEDGQRDHEPESEEAAEEEPEEPDDSEEDAEYIYVDEHGNEIPADEAEETTDDEDEEYEWVYEDDEDDEQPDSEDGAQPTSR